MESLYQPYSNLTEEQRKLLCFLAYTGKKTDEKLLSVYRQGEDLNADQLSPDRLRGWPVTFRLAHCPRRR